jgi:hypothetical protein
MPRLAGECRGRGPHRPLGLVELGQFLPQMLRNWELGIGNLRTCASRRVCIIFRLWPVPPVRARIRRRRMHTQWVVVLPGRVVQIFSRSSPARADLSITGGSSMSGYTKSNSNNNHAISSQSTTRVQTPARFGVDENILHVDGLVISKSALGFTSQNMSKLAAQSHAAQSGHRPPRPPNSARVAGRYGGGDHYAPSPREQAAASQNRRSLAVDDEGVQNYISHNTWSSPRAPRQRFVLTSAVAGNSRFISHPLISKRRP